MTIREAEHHDVAERIALSLLKGEIERKARSPTIAGRGMALKAFMREAFLLLSADVENALRGAVVRVGEEEARFSTKREERRLHISILGYEVEVLVNHKGEIGVRNASPYEKPQPVKGLVFDPDAGTWVSITPVKNQVNERGEEEASVSVILHAIGERLRAQQRAVALGREPIARGGPPIFRQGVARDRRT